MPWKKSGVVFIARHVPQRIGLGAEVAHLVIGVLDADDYGVRPAMWIKDE